MDSTMVCPARALVSILSRRMVSAARHISPLVCVRKDVGYLPGARCCSDEWSSAAAAADADVSAAMWASSASSCIFSSLPFHVCRMWLILALLASTWLGSTDSCLMMKSDGLLCTGHFSPSMPLK